MRRRESARLFCQRARSATSLAESGAVIQKGIRTNVGVCNGRSLAPDRHAEADGKGDRTHLETAAETTFPEAAISECTLVPSWRGAKA